MLHIRIPYPGAAWTRIEHFASFFAKSGHQVYIAGSFSLMSINRFGIISRGELSIFNLTPVIEMGNIFSIIFNSLSSLVTSIGLIGYLRPDTIIISVPNGQTAIRALRWSKVAT